VCWNKKRHCPDSRRTGERPKLSFQGEAAVRQLDWADNRKDENGEIHSNHHRFSFLQGRGSAVGNGNYRGCFPFLFYELFALCPLYSWNLGDIPTFWQLLDDNTELLRGFELRRILVEAIGNVGGFQPRLISP
jgi:hypothetical protein